MLAISILVVGILSRLVIHVPNFTPVIALALFSGAYLKRGQAFVVPLLMFVISDIIIGFHSTFIFTWASAILIILIGKGLQQRVGVKNVVMASLLSSVVFFIVTNLGVWLVGGLYPLTLAGLTECFVLAVPFFHWELISALIYSVLFFGLYEWLAVRLRPTKFAYLLQK